MVMVRVNIRVYVMILFCRNIALFSVFYAFHIYISHSRVLHYTRTHYWLYSVYAPHIVNASARRVRANILLLSIFG